ncbi:hypothetical protein SANTM175S_06330 [Streptomyces antimycoticus]
MSAAAADRARYDRATAHLEAPVAIVDLGAFDDNARDLVHRAGGKPIRVASKSVRCRALLERVLARDGFAGIMSFTLPESLWLAREGFDDVLLAYPSTDRDGFATLTSDPKLAEAVTVIVDDRTQLDLIDRRFRAGTRRGPGSAWNWTLRCGCSAGGCGSGRCAHRCANPSNWPSWRGRSTAAPASGWSG